jgi:hypothetical protein
VDWTLGLRCPCSRPEVDVRFAGLTGLGGNLLRKGPSILGECRGRAPYREGLVEDATWAFALVEHCEDLTTNGNFFLPEIH